MRHSITSAAFLLLFTLSSFAQTTTSQTDTLSSAASEFMKVYNNPDTALVHLIDNMLVQDKAAGSVPDANDFRKAFMALIPAMQSEFRDIGYQQTSGDLDDGLTLIPSEERPLPGTANNNYESLIDGITLTYDVTLRAGIDSNLTAGQAMQSGNQWKAMLQAAFRESVSLFTDKTDSDGNRFISVAYLNNPSQPDYSGGFTLTLQVVKEKEKYNIDLVIVEKKEK